MRKIFLTAATPEYKELADLVEPQKKAYAEKWGLEYVRDEYPEPMSCWDRPKLWLKHLQTCDYMFWTGADCQVTNTEIDPDYFIDRVVDLMICADGNGINNDVFIMHYNAHTREFLGRVIYDTVKRGDQEQEAMSAILANVSHYDLLRGRLGNLSCGGVPASIVLKSRLEKMLRRGPLFVQLEDQKALNAYPQQYYGRTGKEDYSWQPGDFIAHLPGMSLKQRLKAMREIHKLAGIIT